MGLFHPRWGDLRAWRSLHGVYFASPQAWNKIEMYKLLIRYFSVGPMKFAPMTMKNALLPLEPWTRSPTFSRSGCHRLCGNKSMHRSTPRDTFRSQWCPQSTSQLLFCFDSNIIEKSKSENISLPYTATSLPSLYLLFVPTLESPIHLKSHPLAIPIRGPNLPYVGI